MKKILAILAGVVAVITIALFIFISTFDINQYKDELVKLVEDKTGREFAVEGELELAASLIPTVKVEKVSLGNANWASAKQMVSVEEFEIELALLPLLSGNVMISHINLDSAKINLETKQDGTGNWAFDTGEKEPEKAETETDSAAPAVNINEINIQNSKLSFKDGVTKTEKNIVINEFTMEGSAFSSSLDLILDALYNEVPIKINGSLGSISAFTNNESFPIDVDADIGGMQLKLKGDIDEPAAFKGFMLDIDLKTETFSMVEKLAGKKLPELGSVVLKGQVSEKKGIYSFSDLNAKLLDSDIMLNGSVLAENPAKEMNVDIKLSSPSLSNFNKLETYTGKNFPDIGPVELDGKITGQDGFYLLEGVKASIGNDTIAIDGKLLAETPAQGFNLALDFKTDTVANYSAIAGTDLPDTGPLTVKGKVSEEKGIYNFKGVEANMGETRLVVNGKVSDVKQARGSDLKIDFKTPKLSNLNKVAGSELPGIGPISLAAHVTDDKGAYQLKSMKFIADKTDLTGDFYINMTGERPNIVANLTSNLIDLVPYTQKEEKKESKPKAKKVFSSEPLPFDTLKAADAKLDIKAKSIKTADLDMSNVSLVMTLNNGKLALKPLSANLAGGSLNLDLDLNASSGKSAALSTNLKVRDFQPSTLPDLKEKLTGAKTNIDANATGSGQSVASIMAGLNGKYVMKIGSGSLKSSTTEKATGDIFLSAFDALYPGEGRSRDTNIKCGVVNLNIKDGIATSDKGIAFDTEKMNIIGSGVINLKTEELDIGIDPQAREGVGISAGQLAELVRVGGTLAEPKAKPDTKAALKTAASVGAAVATGGLSILAQGLLDRKTADTSPCDTALGITPKKTTTTAKEDTATEKPTEEKGAVEKTTDTVKDAAGAIGDKLKSLF